MEEEVNDDGILTTSKAWNLLLDCIGESLDIDTLQVCWGCTRIAGASFSRTQQ